MDKYSFLNSAHTAYFAELYDQYLEDPDIVEPSWRAFFQGFDFGVENGGSQVITGDVEVPESVKKEFQVVRLIEGYRTRGHLFTKTNPVRDRRMYSPNLDVENFGLTEADLSTVFNAGSIVGIGPSTLATIIEHLQKTYCESIGVEYMYIRNVEKKEWIKETLTSKRKSTQFQLRTKTYLK